MCIYKIITHESIDVRGSGLKVEDEDRTIKNTQTHPPTLAAYQRIYCFYVLAYCDLLYLNSKLTVSVLKLAYLLWLTTQD